MKFKFLLAIIYIFLVNIPSVYSQIDLMQMEALTNLAQGGPSSQDSDLPMDSSSEMKPREISATIDKQENSEENNELNDFGYQGRNDFLLEPRSKFSNEPLKYFGYDYFLNYPSLFLPRQNVPIPSDYVLGPGDEIKIILFGNQNKKYNLQINREGDIFIPEIGPISVAGLTFNDLRETINQIIDNRLIGTQVNLTLGNLRSINIFVLGEATNPGLYTVSALSKLTNAVFSNGGIKKTGSLRNIQLKRNGEIITEFDFYDLLLKGDTSNDVSLMSGDVVFIPPTQKLVGIAGEVKRPGIYELKDNENGEDLLNFSGSLKAKANLSTVELERIDASSNGYSLKKIDLEELPFSEIELKDGDKLAIYPIAEKLNNAILLRGHIQKGGFYPWKDGMRIKDRISSIDDLLPMTDMNYVLIKREIRDSQRYNFIQLNLEELFRSSESQENIRLENRDEIIFFPSLLDLDLVKTVPIEKDEYENDDKQLTTYFARKSILEVNGRKSILEANEEEPDYTIDEDETPDSGVLSGEQDFYYQVYDYCIVPQDKLTDLLEIEETDTQLQTEEIDMPLLADADMNNAYDDSLDLTNHCRRQIIDPILAIIKKQSRAEMPDSTITIYGNVSYPGEYPLTQNSTVKDALNASGGLRGLTFNEIDLSKKNINNKDVSESISIIGFDDIEETTLEPLDIITVKKIAYEPSTVTILGEVYFPGKYPISKTETFANLIERAGGLKDNAGVENIFFQRRSLIETEIKRFREAQGNLRKQLLISSGNRFGQEEGSDEYLSQISLLADESLPDISSLGRLIIDLEGDAKEIILEDQDNIFIPRIPQTVKVIGEVYASNSHLHNPTYKINDYIGLSGGLNSFADKDSIYIIKANGSVIAGDNISNGFFRNSSNNIQPGDTVVVPLRIDTFSGLQATTEITQIIYQMALSAAAVNSF